MQIIRTAAEVDIPTDPDLLSNHFAYPALLCWHTRNRLSFTRLQAVLQVSVLDVMIKKPIEFACLDSSDLASDSQYRLDDNNAITKLEVD